MHVVTTGRQVREIAGDGAVLVPTMGALHEGHASLVRQAAARAVARGAGGARPAVVVSVFVNPTQFGPGEDFTRYPRTLEADVASCDGAGADVVFAPPVEEMYPATEQGGRDAEVRLRELPRVATEPGLEDAQRPGHFAGVCQVVRRLFEVVRPACAVFGEKDWQQLQVVRAMVKQEGLEVEIVPSETVRDPDGLAMSSRNRFLTAEERARGLALIRGLRAAQRAATPGEGERAMREALREADVVPDYAVVRDAETLEAVRRAGGENGSRPMRAVVAARVGSVRLLDNVAWPARAGT